MGKSAPKTYVFVFNLCPRRSHSTERYGSTTLRDTCQMNVFGHAGLVVQQERLLEFFNFVWNQ